VRILAVDDDDLVLSAIKIALTDIQDDSLRITRCHTANSSHQIVPLLEREPIDVTFLDLDMGEGVYCGGLKMLKEIKKLSPETICIILTGHDEPDVINECMNAGAFDYLVKPFTNGRLKIAMLKAQYAYKLIREKRALKAQCEMNSSAITSLKTKSPLFQNCLSLAEKIAGKKIPVLLTGETGTGKDVLARHIWSLENESSRPMISVHCGAITENLVESTLFGHVKGAFTGAEKSRAGVFEAAHGGDIFLDEIATMPLEVQIKLLRTLNTGEVVRVGETQGRQFDFRLISATNESLTDLVAQKSFREDLFYRLKGLEIHLPALRERMEDFEDLVTCFFKAQGVPQKRLSPKAMDFCLHYSWPGNIRQLERMISVLSQLCDEDEISLNDVQGQLSGETSGSHSNLQSRTLGDNLFVLSKNDLPGSYNVMVEECEKSMVSYAFEETKNFSAAAKYLGITRQSLNRRTNTWGWNTRN